MTKRAIYWKDARTTIGPEWRYCYTDKPSSVYNADRDHFTLLSQVHPDYRITEVQMFDEPHDYPQRPGRKPNIYWYVEGTTLQIRASSYYKDLGRPEITAPIVAHIYTRSPLPSHMIQIQMFDERHTVLRPRRRKLNLRGRNA